MKKIVLLLSLCGLMMTSCLAPSKMVYMKDMRPEILYTLSQRPLLRIQQQDRLRILVSSRNPELAAPFNLGVAGYQVGSDGEVRTTSNMTIRESGYLVDRQGNIEFPILGILRVEGLTIQEVSNLVQNRLREERQISDAIVSVDILNFKIMLIGEVGSIGIQDVPEEKITLLEAITIAGGVTPNASLGEIAVIREDRRGYRMIMNDLRSVAVLESPAFYLQQNDIVYVKPKGARMSERENRSWQWYNTALGLGNTLISVLLLINYYK